MSQKKKSPFSRLARSLKEPFRRARQEAERQRLAEERAAHPHMLSADRSAEALAEALRAGTPYAAGKIGSDELKALNIWQDHRPSERRWRKMKVGALAHRGVVPVTNSGIYPVNDSMMSAFCEAYIDALAEIDLLCVWFNIGEKRAIDRYMSPTHVADAHALRNHILTEPWSAALEGRSVLVVAPFAETIRHQYARREAVWRRRPGTLPEFKLDVLRTQVNAGLLQNLEYSDWRDGLATLKAGLDRSSADVVLVGAGAWSLPLVAHAKRQGRFAAHLGGDLQLLFGITGGRWEQDPNVAAVVTDAWRRVLPEETPETERVQALRSTDSYW